MKNSPPLFDRDHQPLCRAALLPRLLGGDPRRIEEPAG